MEATHGSSTRKCSRNIPLFALLDDEEAAVLASQVELKTFAPRERIYKVGDPGAAAYVVISGKVTCLHRGRGPAGSGRRRAGNAASSSVSLPCSSRRRTRPTPLAIEESACLEISRDDIAVLLSRKPMAGMDLLTTLGRQLHADPGFGARSAPAEIQMNLIEKEATTGERIADHVARFGGSWTFIITFAVLLTVYTAANVILDKQAWDPYPFILLNLFLSMLAAVQAPVIMMSQNRQDTRDRLRAELDFDVNRRAESEIQGLSQKLIVLDEKLDDVADALRKKGI